jgi:hypothetical protein
MAFHRWRIPAPGGRRTPPPPGLVR